MKITGRFTTILLVSTMTLSLFSCGKVKIDEETQHVIDRIDSIGTVEYEDETLIGEIEDEYFALSDEQKAQVSNLDVLSAARETVDALILAKPLPFSDANWETTQDELIEMMGKNPDDEYDNTYEGVTLEYNNTKYDGFIGVTQYYFNKDNLLVSAGFEMSEYEETAYNHFNDLYTTDYGEPGFENEVGKVWYTESATIGLVAVQFFGGSIKCVFTSPELLEE